MMPLSVPLSKRKQGKLETLTRARELCAYTIQICKNEKNFPKRDRWLLTQPIVTETLSIMSCIRRANSVRVETREDYVYRRGQQIEAFACAGELPIVAGERGQRQHARPADRDGQLLPDRVWREVELWETSR